MVQLTDDAKALVHSEVEKGINEVLGRVVRWIALGNTLGFGAILLYVFQFMPQQISATASEKVVEEIKGRTKNLLAELDQEHAEAFVSLGHNKQSAMSVREALNTLSMDVAHLKAEAETLKATFTEVNGSNMSSIQLIISTLSAHQDLSSFLSKQADLVKDIEKIGLTVDQLMSGNATKLKVNNPRIGGADKADCAPGSFVTSIHASGAVGGRYAVDGISEISFTCDYPIRN